MSYVEEIQKTMGEILETFKTNQKERQKTCSIMQQLEAQLSENTIVQEELSLLAPENTVYKLTGPVLVRQDQEESKQNVAKRIEYINNEIKRVDSMLKGFDEKLEQQRSAINELQKQLNEAQIKVA